MKTMHRKPSSALLIGLIMIFFCKAVGQTAVYYDYGRIDSLQTQNAGGIYNTMFFDLNTNYPDTSANNFKLHWALVRFDSIYDASTQTPYARNSTTVEVNTVHVVYRHQNITGTPDTIVITIYAWEPLVNGIRLNAQEEIINPVLYDTMIITTTSLTGLSQSGILTVSPGLTLSPPDNRFLAGVHFYGDTSNTFQIACGYGDRCGNSCYAYPSVFADNSIARIIAWGANQVRLTGLSNLRWFDCNMNTIYGEVSACELIPTQNFAITVNATATPCTALISTLNPAICSGQATTLTAMGGATYLWSTGDTTQSITVSPSVSTTYQVVAGNSSGCLDTASATIIVHPNPTAAINPSPAVICPWQSSVLTAVGIGGTPPYDYNWSNGNASSSITVLLIFSGSYSYSLTITDSEGCTASATSMVTVNPKPIAAFSYSVQQNTFTFQNNSIGNALTFWWDFGDGVTSTLPNPVHTYNDSGAHRICLTATDSLTGCSHSACMGCRAFFSYTVTGDTVYFTNSSSPQDSTLFIMNYGDGQSDTAYGLWTWTPPPHYYPPGIYVSCLSISTYPDSCTDFFCDTITVGDMVWPGDANYDGIANNQDILAIGINYGNSGPARPNATTNWVGQPCPDWQLQFLSGVNLKHADCDGNAVIDSSDVAVVSLNYGLTHQKRSDPERAVNPDLFLVFPQDSFQTGDTVTGEIHLGTQNTPVNDIYGIAFSLAYNQNIIDTNGITVDFINSWFTPQSNRIGLAKDLYSASRTDIGLSRISHTNASGSGVIANVSFVIQDNIDGKDYFVLPLEIQFEDVVAIDKDETAVNITANGDTLYVEGYTTGIAQAPLNHNIRIFPNPAANEIHVMADVAMVECSILDITGREILKEIPSRQRRMESLSFAIDISSLESGSYFIQLKTADHYSVCRKIIVCK